jgi:hypothetical protein
LSRRYPATTRAPSIPNGIAAGIMQAGTGAATPACGVKAQGPATPFPFSGPVHWPTRLAPGPAGAPYAACALFLSIAGGGTDAKLQDTPPRVGPAAVLCAQHMC